MGWQLRKLIWVENLLLRPHKGTVKIVKSGRYYSSTLRGLTGGKGLRKQVGHLKNHCVCPLCLVHFSRELEVAVFPPRAVAGGVGRTHLPSYLIRTSFSSGGSGNSPWSCRSPSPRGTRTSVVAGQLFGNTPLMPGPGTSFGKLRLPDAQCPAPSHHVSHRGFRGA